MITAIYDNLRIELHEVRKHLQEEIIDVSKEGDLDIYSEIEKNELRNLINSAKRKADNYCQNEFQVTVAEVILSNPSIGDTVIIDGEEFIYESFYSEIDREFSTASELSDIINSNLLRKNGKEVGIPYLKATANGDTISVESQKTDPPIIDAGSEGIDYQYRYEVRIPDDVKHWCLEFIGRLYEKRQSGLKSLNIEDSDSIEWGEIDYDLIRPYRTLDFGRIKEE